MIPGIDTPAWTEVWPTEPGWWWYYGTWTRNDFDARLSAVKIRKGAGDAVFYVADGANLWRSEGAFGVWLPLVPPEIPRVSVCSAHSTPAPNCAACGTLL
jgi:hypothetical protein